MLLLAIDPGYRESHAVLYRPSGEVRGCWSLPNDDMLDFLRARSGVHERVLIESMDPFGLRLGRETMDTILWIGRFMEAGRAELVPRSLIKMTLCGTRRADDASIRRVLIDRLGAPGTRLNPGWTYGVSGHRWQALAVAVTWLEVNKEILCKGGDAQRTPMRDPTPIGNEAPAGADSPGPSELPLFERRDDALPR